MRLNLDMMMPAALPMPRLSQKLEALADNLARFAAEFGIETNQNFGPRLATIGVSNGVLLGLMDPESACVLEAQLVFEGILTEPEVRGLAGALAQCLKGETDWTDEINGFLRGRWDASAENSANLDPVNRTRLRLLHGVRTGLLVAREDGDNARKVVELMKLLLIEHRFLADRLVAWARNDWNPSGPPFVEYVGTWYGRRVVEQRIVRTAVWELYPVAKSLENPWSFPFWVETGWSTGRRLASDHPQDCKALFQEASADLKGYLGFFKRFILGTSRSDGEVQIVRATLAYIGEHKDENLSRSYCTGCEPRRLATLAFDFAFWMGIFSSHPLP